MNRRAVRAGAAVAAALLLASCAAGTGDVQGRGGGSWTELPSAPLSPRTGAVAAWTGSEALFLGGETGGFCPPNASCTDPVELARDGAAYDPVSGTWRRTADAPRPLALGSTAVAGDTVHVLVEDRLLSYDASEDAWSVSPPVPSPGDAWWGGLAALEDGDVVVAAGERQDGAPPDQVYDPEDRTWADLPADPLGPSFARSVTAVPGALVLTGVEWVPNPGSAEPPVLRGAVLHLATRQWRLLEDSDQLGGHWAWTGSRLVAPTPGEEDGGETNGWGRSVPYAGALDPYTGEWQRLEDVPEALSGGWPVHALGGPVSAVDGWVYDDADGSWTLLARPPDAPARPGSAVWAGDRLVVAGGHDSDAGWGEEHLTNAAWMWTPSRPAAQADGVPTPEDPSGAWALVEGTSGGAPIDLPAGGRATLVVEEATLGGTAFCNDYGGRYELDGSTLVLNGVGGTEMACAPDLMAAEEAYLTVLRGGRLDVSLEDGELVLRADEGTLRFRSLRAVAISDLAGTRWVLESLVDGGTVLSPAGDPAVLELRGDGTVTGSTGCREFTGTWDTFGDEVRFPDFGFEQVVECPAEPAAQDGHVVGVLEGGFPVSIDGDVLTATGSDGTGLVYRAG